MLLPLLLSLPIALSQPAARVTLMEIQGRAHRSPWAGERVVTEGVVTAIAPQGFFLQDAGGDDDPATSDAAFVSIENASARAGDLVVVEGTVVERSAGDPGVELSTTLIEATRIGILERGRAPAPAVVIGAGGRVPAAAIIDDDALEVFEPAKDGIDFYESLEGMRVVVESARVVAPPGPFGDAWVVPARVATGLNPRGGITAGARDANPERIRIRDAVASAGSRSISTGSELGNVSGVLSYAYGSFALIPDPPDSVSPRLPEPETTPLTSDETHLLIASFNLRNFGPGDRSRARLFARIIVSNLRAPDLLALQEIQDDSGPLDDGTVAADSSYRILIDAVRAAGGPVYEARDLPPVDGADGGEPGGNIRTAFLFRPDRVTLVARFDGDPAGPPFDTHPIAGVDGVRLTRSPGRVDPANRAWLDSRKPLAAEFEFGGRRFFVVAVHLRSKSGSTPDFGATQPPVNAGAPERAAQARVIRAFVQEIHNLDAHARVVVLGDFNDDGFSQTLAILEENRALLDLARSIPAPERYSFVFDGNSHAYDHVLAGPAGAWDADFDVVHVNAEYGDAASDHDPVVARLSFAARTDPDPAGALPLIAYPNPSAGEVVLDAGATGNVEISIFSVGGARLRTLGATGGRAVWDGRDARGRLVAAGVYFARARGEFGEVTRRVVLVR